MQYKKIRIKSHIYKFDNSETMLNSIAKLYSEINCKSILFLFSNKYYLEMPHRISRLEKFKISENIFTKYYLEEYGKIISLNAVNEIGRTFKDF